SRVGTDQAGGTASRCLTGCGAALAPDRQRGERGVLQHAVGVLVPRRGAGTAGRAAPAVGATVRVTLIRAAPPVPEPRILPWSARPGDRFRLWCDGRTIRRGSADVTTQFDDF